MPRNLARQIVDALDNIDAAPSREVEIARELPDGSTELIITEGPDNSVLHVVTVKSYYRGPCRVLARLR